MTVIANSQVSVEWAEGSSSRTALIAVKNVTTGDTLDVGQAGISTHSRVKSAIMTGTTVIGSAAAGVSGTVVTMPAGLANDSAFVLVFGCAF